MFRPSDSSFAGRAACGGLTCFALVALMVCPVPRAFANTYATNLRINGGTTNVSAVSGTNVLVSYLLNEPASAGVTITIKSNATTVRTISLTGGGAGTARGANSVVWNGKDDSSNNVAAGLYSIHVTASATGHADWAQISSDADEGNYAYSPMSIAVNRNPGSPYYGRVFIANSLENPFGLFQPGDAVGVLKANPDGSPAAEGAWSTGGWAWAGESSSPWKLEVSADDFTYVSDRSTNGFVLRFDQTISPDSLTLALRDDNWPDSSQAILAGPAIVGSGTNTQIWMADTRTNGVGLRRFQVSSDGSLATNDLGITIVPVGGDSPLTDYPYDVAIDKSNRIYTIQYETESGNTNARVLRFPAYVGTGPEITNADWRIGSGDDDLRGASGIAVDAVATNVAVVFRGVGSGFSRTGGGVRVFSAEDGSDVWTLLAAPGNDYTDVAWDHVGNLYLCDNYDRVWRAYSPPGENQATTIALATVQMSAAPAPLTLSNPLYAAGQFQFTLNGQPDVTYAILASTDLQAWTPVATNTAATATRSISLDAPEARSFYRALVSP